MEETVKQNRKRSQKLLRDRDVKSQIERRILFGRERRKMTLNDDQKK